MTWRHRVPIEHGIGQVIGRKDPGRIDIAEGTAMSLVFIALKMNVANIHGRTPLP